MYIETVVCVKELCRTYSSVGSRKTVNALKGISFEIKRGEIFGLLGPNGAGKTTTIKILTTLLAPTSGQSKVLGFDTFGEEKKIRPHINFIFGGESGVYRRLTGRENLNYFANLYNLDKDTRLERREELLRFVGLSEYADKKVETYSKGMIQRLQIARGLINEPDILFLDEPTIGLDPVGARELRSLIKKLSEQDKTILLTTHYMQEADELCDRIAVINHGNLIALDTPEKLKAESGLTTIIEVVLDEIRSETLELIKKIAHIKTADVEKYGERQTLRIHCSYQQNVTEEVLELLKQHHIVSFVERDMTLEDVYVKLVGGNI